MATYVAILRKFSFDSGELLGFESGTVKEIKNRMRYYYSGKRGTIVLHRVNPKGIIIKRKDE